MANNYEDGVWRTVGGRRIFIKDGQSLSDAMKSSGKFKKSSKKSWRDEDKEDQGTLRDTALQAYKKGDITKEELIKDYFDEKTEDGGTMRDTALEAYKNGDITLEELNRDYLGRGKVKTLSGENEKDNKGREVSQKEYDEFRKAYMDGKISKEDYKNDNYDALKKESSKEKEEIISVSSEEAYKKGLISKESHEANMKYKAVADQKRDIENASELKVEKAFGTDAWGTGNEDRFKLADGRYIAHDLETDTWSMNKTADGKIHSRDYKSYNDMLDHLREEANSEERAQQKANWFKANEARESNRSNNAYKKAFEDYKKKHPNSKITLQKFIDMSEGK